MAIKHKMECPCCGHKFTLTSDYETGDCEKCGHHYYWDHVYDEESGETFFEGYYWDPVKKKQPDMYDGLKRKLQEGMGVNAVFMQFSGHVN